MASNQNSEKKQKTLLLHKLYVDKDVSLNRTPLEVGRFKYMRSIIGRNYSKVIGLNLLFVLFILPAALLIAILLPKLELEATSGLNFGGNIGIGYPNAPNDPLIGKLAIYDARIFLITLLIPCFSLIGLGAAGVFYCCRNLMWGSQIKVFKHFFRGIKLYWWRFIAAFTYLGGLVALCGYSVINNLKLMLTQSSNAGSWILMIFSLILALVSLMFFLFYLPMVTCYKFKERYYWKNSGIFMVSLIPTTLINIVLMGLPFLLLLVNMLSMLLVMFFAMMGLVIYVLWITNYGQFAGDNFINVLYELKQHDENKKFSEEKRKAQKAKVKQQSVQQRPSYKNKKGN